MANSRRDFFKKSLGAAAVLVSAKAVEAAVCQVTARQTSGPFIPNDFPFREPNEGAPYFPVADNNADLTQIDGHAKGASGQVIYVHGQVVDQRCEPVANATVYLWQADEHGHYNHAEDPNVKSTADLDPDFQYRGVVSTDAQGRFGFKTIKPKYYPLDDSGQLVRTAHLHVAVLHPQTERLVTQTYFEGDVLEDIERIRQLNANDIILSPRGEILPELRPLIIEFRREAGVLDGVVGHVTLTVRRRS